MGMDAIKLARTRDRGRGFFCKTDKEGNPLGLPPVSREPKRSKNNPRAVRHVDKTRQDRMAPAQRPRVQEWQKRQGA